MTDIQRDLEAKITANPLAAIAIALAAGAIVGLAGARSTKDHAPNKRSIRGMLFGGVSAIVMGMIRSAVVEHLSGAAKTWLGPDSVAPRDPSPDPVASFLEH